MQTRTHSLTRYAQCARSLAHLTIYIMCDGNIFATTTMLGVEAGGWWVGGGRRCGEAGDATNAQRRGDGSAGAHVQIWSSNPNKSRKPICQSFLCRTFFLCRLRPSRATERQIVVVVVGVGHSATAGVTTWISTVRQHKSGREVRLG